MDLHERLLFTPCYDKADDSGAGAEPEVKTPADPKSEFRQLAAELKDLVTSRSDKTATEYKEQFEKISNRMDELEFDYQTHKKMSSDPQRKEGELVFEDAFKKAFWEFVKGNRDGLTLEKVTGEKETKSIYHPSMKGGEQKSDNLVRFDFASTGALLLPAEMSQQILYNAIESTPVARLVNTTTTSRSQKHINLRVSTPGINWVDEEGTTPKGKITYRRITLTPKKAASRYGATIENEQDSGYDLFGEMRTAYQEDFTVGVGTAVVSGDGNGKPKGMVGELTGFNSGATTLTANMLIDLQEQLLEVYQESGQWLFTRQTRAFIRKLFVTSNNAALQYLWEPDFTRRSPTLLLGAPVNIARQDDMAGALDGEFSAGEVPVLFGDFRRAYELTTHTDMFIIDDPYTESAQWVRNLNIMSRVDGQPTQTEAAAELRITTS